MFSSAEAERLGASRSMLHRRVAAGRLERVFPGVFRVAGAPPTWEQMLAAACLCAGGIACASHAAAARLWGSGPFDTAGLEISIPRRQQLELPDVVIHRPQDLAGIDTTSFRQIPVTTATRTVIDLAGTAPRALTEAAFDDALRRRLTSLNKIERHLERLGRRGRPGIALVRELVAGRRGQGVTDSELETLFLRILRSTRLPRPVLQHVVRDRGRFLARLDFAYPDLRLAIEIDSYEHHSGRAHFERDRRWLSRLAALGWRILHITWAQLVNEPDEVARLVARAIIACSATSPA